MAIYVLTYIALAYLGPGSDPGELVARLGSTRFVDREDASRRLEALDREALPSLRLALGSEDLEIRTRAAGLMRKIEFNGLTRPTQLLLNYREVELGKILEDVERQSGIKVLAAGSEGESLALGRNSRSWLRTR